MRPYIFFIILFVISSHLLKAQPTINLDENFKVNSIGDKTEFLIDTKNTISIDSLLKNNTFYTFKSLNKLNNTSNSRVWMRIRLNNTSEGLFVVLLKFSDSSFPPVYAIYPSGNSERIYPPFMNKESDTKKFLVRTNNAGWGYYSYWINLPQKAYTTLYVLLERKNMYLANNPILIANYEYVNAKRASRNLIQGLFQGIVWILALYHLIIFFTSKRRLYLHYSLYLIVISIVFLIPFGLIIIYLTYYPEFVVAVVSNSLVSLCYFLFISSFLENEEAFQIFKKAILNYIRIKLIITALLIPLISTSVKNLVFPIVNLLLLMEMIFNLFILIYMNIKGGLFVKYFSIANYLLVLGAGIGVIMLLLNPLDNSSGYFMEAGVVAQALTLGLGLGYRMRYDEIEKQAAQKELIAQLEENKELQEKVTRELEEKVQERTLEISNQKALIERKNKDITDSINYASLIQGAVLPQPAQIKEYLAGVDSFVLYMPRDIVSGDFYWLEKIGDLTFVAVVDCTGHGVPGAFMSMMAISFLNDIVVQRNIIEVNEILNELRRLVIASLKESGNRAGLNDGMDIALCAIHSKTLEMKYAGAHNPALIVRKSNQDTKLQLIELKADRIPVGNGPKSEVPFTLQEFKLEKGDTIYLYSDGYSDQFGGKAGSRFMSKNFKNLLIEISSKPLEEQKNLLYNKSIEWKADFQQTDDILVMGIRV